MLTLLMEWDGRRVMTDAKVIRAEELELLRQADQVLYEARQQAQRVMAEAELASQLERDLARAEGEQQGRAMAARELAVTVMSRQASLRQHEHVVADTVVYFLERLLAHDAQIYADRVRSLVSDTTARDWLRIRVPQPMHAETERAVQQMLAGSPLRIDVQGDPQIAAGNAVIETDYGVVDAQLDAILDGVQHAVAEALKTMPAPAPQPVAAVSAPTAAAVPHEHDDGAGSRFVDVAGGGQAAHGGLAAAAQQSQHGGMSYAMPSHGVTGMPSAALSGAGSTMQGRRVAGEVM